MNYHAQKTTLADFVEHADEYLESVHKEGEVFIEREGVWYRLEQAGNRTHDVWAFYDPARAMETFERGRQMGNVLKGVDTERLKQDIRDARGHGIFRH
jgi:hypothetical protein